MSNTLDTELLRSIASLLDTLPVSGFEERAYQWLLGSFWRGVLEPLPRSKRNAVSISFSPSGQLCVDYTGRAADPNRLVFVCHVDREGLVASVSGHPMLTKAANANNKQTRRMIVPSAKADEEFLNYFDKQKVCVSAGRARVSVARCRFVRESEGNTFRHWLESIDGDDRSSAFLARPELDSVAITPTPDTEEFDPSLPESRTLRTGDSERLTASALDNCVGVVAASHALLIIIQRGLAANVSVVYTIGEETGFLGAIALARDEAPRGWWGKNVHAVVVDTSSRLYSHSVGMGAWRQLLDSGKDIEKQRYAPVDERAAAVRL